MPKIIVTRAGNTLTVSDGKRTRQSVCATTGAAKGQETKLKNNPTYAAHWLKAFEPIQLELPLPLPSCLSEE